MTTRDTTRVGDAGCLDARLRRLSPAARARSWALAVCVLGAMVAGAERAGPVATTVVATAQAGPGPLATTLDDQQDVALTVYNSQLALVRDVRRVSLPAGTFDLRFMDIASTVNPATVHVRSLTDAGGLRMLEQNYEYDLLEPAKLLRKYVGRDVTLVRTRQESGSTRTTEVTARLLAFNNGPVWRIGNEIVTGMHADHFRFPSLPDNLYERPTLVWTLDADDRREHRVEASYLAGGISWSADYVLTVGRDDASADLDGWVTLTNESGTEFLDTSLKLVAGELNRVRQHDVRSMERSDVVPAAAEPSFRQEAFSEYHLYSLERRTSVRNHETKQVSLLSGSGVPTVKRYVVDGHRMYYRNRRHPGSPLGEPVKVYYTLHNDAASGLGMPLPAGVVRVYQADGSDAVQFAGEDRIDHTPRDERIDLHVGNAFDIVAERVQTDFEKIADDAYEMAFRLTLRNHKDTPITVEVNEPFGGTWSIRRASHEAVKTSAWAARFDVAVEANAESVLDYRVRVRW